MRIPQLVLGILILVFVGAFLWDTPPKFDGEAGTVSITYWEKWTGFEGEAMRNTIELFNKKGFKNSKGQRIVCRFFSTTQVDRKSLLSIAGGQPPDLVGIWSNNTHVFADMNALTPLDDYIKRDHFDMDKYIDVFRDYCVYRGNTWCLCTTPATVALHWNKKMFREAGLDPDRPPRTLEELAEYNVKLTKRDADGKLIQTGFLPIEPGWWSWAWGYWFGGKLNDGPTKITANDPKNIKAWEWACSFCKGFEPEQLQAFKQGFGTSFDSPQNAFMSEKVAMVIQGVWMANFIRFNNPRVEWDCAPLPAGFDTGGQPVTVAEMDVIAIPRGAHHPDEAWEVVKFINSQEGMEFLCGGRDNNGGQGKLTPFKQNTPGWIEQHDHPHLQVFIDLAKSKNAATTPKLAVWEEYRRELTSAFDLVWLKKMTAAEALNAVQVRMQAKLDQAIARERMHHEEK